MINRSLRRRLQRLEAELRLDKGQSIRIGRLRELPADYTGERHVATVWEREMESGRHSCSFEERPRPAPPGPRDPVPWLCLTQTQMDMIGDPI
jgi:hypothetical protein